ncbi:hypothetical protein BGZ74_004324, partial [Mortierella antarctica]
MYDFYHHVDSTFYAPSSSTKASYPAWSFTAFFGRLSIPPCLFFDASFSPVRDALTKWAVLVLPSYLVMDLTLGRKYYRERISLIGGYVHHSVYLYICSVVLYTNYTVGMVLFFFDEIPTAVLGTGFVFPQLRHDTLFGLVYFITQMVLDPLMAHEILRNTTMTPMGKFVTVIKNPLNVKFFVDYIQQQKRLRRQKESLEHRASINEIRADIIVKMYFWPRDVDDSSMKLWKVHAPEKTRGLYTLDDSTEPPTPIFSEDKLTKAFAEEAPQGIIHLMAKKPRPRCAASEKKFVKLYPSPLAAKEVSYPDPSPELPCSAPSPSSVRAWKEFPSLVKAMELDREPL